MLVKMQRGEGIVGTLWKWDGQSRNQAGAAGSLPSARRKPLTGHQSRRCAQGLGQTLY